MLSNYLKTALRNLLKNKIFSVINIFGLAMGMTCSLLIWLWVEDERAMDAFHTNDDYLYVIVQRQYHDGVVDAGHFSPGILPEELKIVFPEVRYATGGAWDEEHTFEGNNKTLKQLGTYGSPDFFSVFSYTLLEGQPETAVKTPQDIALSRKMAEAFFGSPKAAMGQTLRFENKKDLRVSAVFENIQSHSSKRFDYLLNWETFLQQYEWARDWGNDGPATYIVLRTGTDAKAFESKIRTFIDRYSKKANFTRRLALQKYADIYLRSNFKNGELAGGRIQYVNLFTIIAVFVLLIACINFMNVSTASSIKRGKEIGVRKVIGAHRSGLVCQFIGEALLIVCFAFILALLMVALVLPTFNTLTQKQINLPFDQYSFWIALLLLTVLTGFVSGSYPALYLSSFNPGNAIKGALKFGSGALWFRKGLVVFQFTLSVLLIIGTIVISRQVSYIQSVNLGYDRENFIFVPLEGGLGEKFDVFKTKLLSQPGIKLISRMSDPPTNIENSTSEVDWDGKDPNSMLQFTQASVGYDFISTMNITMIQGRDFSTDFASDTSAYLLNETALKIISYEDPIGKPITFWGEKGTIVGVMKDFHFTSLHKAIKPLILRLEDNAASRWALVRTEPGEIKKALANLEAVHKNLNPQFPITYQFSDQEYQKLYGNEQLVETLCNVFAALAIVISCLGLLGLAMFTAEQRNKEISIRKILGASLPSLFGLLSKDVFMLIAISLLIASPIAWFLMEDWLEAYAYRIRIGWWMFLVSGGLTSLIALITVSFHTIRALLVNPAKTLRAE